MVRYVQERFIEIELLLNKESGLKIPNTAITEKEFFKVPKEYFAKAQDSSGKGVMIKDPATGSINFIATSLYYETEDSYYIDEDEVHAEPCCSGRIPMKPIPWVKPRNCRAFTTSTKDMPCSSRSAFCIRMRNIPLWRPEQATVFPCMTTSH